MESQSWTRGVFQTLQKWISDELVAVRRQMNRNAIFIVRKEWLLGCTRRILEEGSFKTGALYADDA
jgi:hypothetical protein